jgi:hypothetical protein
MSNWIEEEADKYNSLRRLLLESWQQLKAQIQIDVDLINKNPTWQSRLGGVPLMFIDGDDEYQVVMKSPSDISLTIKLGTRNIKREKRERREADKSSYLMPHITSYHPKVWQGKLCLTTNSFMGDYDAKFSETKPKDFWEVPSEASQEILQPFVYPLAWK